MYSSRDRPHLLSEQSALQHERSPKRGPRPLPLFLELVQLVAAREPETAQAALRGLVAYQRAERAPLRPDGPTIASVGSARLLDRGGRGAPVVLVPSLINPPHVLDLDEDVSLAAAIVAMGRHVLLVDWGPADARRDLDVGGHVEHILVPLLQALGEPAALLGYCLGGTLTIAAANLVPCERVVTLAAPWHFDAYADEGRRALGALWQRARAPAEALDLLPMEVLQAAFWSLDPKRTVEKFAKFSEVPPDSAKARRFVALEDWANEGEALPFPAGRELVEDLFTRDLPGTGRWVVADRLIGSDLQVPLLHCTAARDRITPARSAADGKLVQIDSGHVGMVVGSARHRLHSALADFL